MKIGNSYAWSTHQPLIRAIMELYKPAFVLELGIGNNSTPVLLEYTTKLLSIENNLEWIDVIKKRYKEIDVIYHDLDNITVDTLLKNLNEEQKKKITDYYLKLKIPELKPNFLFVDQYASCRTLSINSLGEKFDFIMYHDCDPTGYNANQYSLINIKGYNTYYLETPTTWTAAMIKKEIDLGYEELFKIINSHIIIYKKNHPEMSYMKLK
jgi:phage antirepressor YoqD-like protein